METTIIFPRLGGLLRTLITCAGYRSYIAKIGLEKDLDDLAKESRQGATCDLMLQVENACRKQLALDCGTEWAQFFSSAWSRTKDSIQYLVLTVDTSPMANEKGQEETLRIFEIPMFAQFLRFTSSRHAGPEIRQWWSSPVASWVEHASTTAKISNDKLLTQLGNHLDAAPRSIERWMAGEPTRELRWPYRPLVREAIGKDAENRIGVDGLDQLAGWLVVAVAFQSLSADLRDQIRRDYDLRPQQPWSLEHTAHAMNEQGFKHGDRPVRASVVPLMERIKRLFATRPPDVPAIHKSLQEFQALIEQEPAFWRLSYQYIHDWFSARVAAITGHDADALRLYDDAVAGVWWYGGPNQHPIINEALLYAVGVGKKVAAEHYWDKTYLLGLNKWPKRPLDEQEHRRLAFGFEQMFSPQKARDRVPPKVEILLREGEYELSHRALDKPNSKVKHAEGRTRRTPLMDAIREGTLDDVKRLLDAGGDPNDFIVESGEGPLSYAMRRACDRKDPIVMEHLLSLDLLPGTVNRQASTKRETPLKIAIEMADFKAIDRLIDLGADIEAECDLQPSALCYAMLLLHGSIHPNDRTQELAYLLGKGRADVYDAKDGAVLDVDLAARRQALLQTRDASSRNQQIFNELMDYYIRPAEDHRQVIQVLLRRGADANRRYKVEAHHLEEWTPTLFAAQVGDLAVFTMIVAKGGDPDRTLMQSSSLEQFDALWVAVAYDRHAIVDFLKERLQQRQQ